MKFKMPKKCQIPLNESSAGLENKTFLELSGSKSSRTTSLQKFQDSESAQKYVFYETHLFSLCGVYATRVIDLVDFFLHGKLITEHSEEFNVVSQAFCSYAFNSPVFLLLI